MARINANSNRLRTYENAPARALTPEQTLERSVMACMLWENQFYESGQNIADRIQELALAVSPVFVAELAYRTRHEANLRHAPLLLLRALARTGTGVPNLVQDAIANTIARADEVAEFLALYWATNDGKKTLSAQVKKGLARAIAKFDEYQLAKWNKDAPVKLRDALRLVRPAPKNEKQSAVFKSVVEKTLRNTKTWEARQSKAGTKVSQMAKELDLTVSQTEKLRQKTKQETWEDQLRKNEVGYDALLKNLRNMLEAEVNPQLVAAALVARRGAHRVLPFRFVAAYNAVKAMGAYGRVSASAAVILSALDQALQGVIAELPQLYGKTAILVDVSASMDDKLSEKSDLRRFDAAAALAALFPGKREIFSFSNQIVPVSGANGLAGIEKVIGSQQHSGTDLGGAVDFINRRIAAGHFDRVIVLTDEQSRTAIAPPACKMGYLINLASYEASVGEKLPVRQSDAPRKRGRYGELEPHSVDFGRHGEWNRITGFSENVFRYIDAAERSKF